MNKSSKNLLSLYIVIVYIMLPILIYFNIIDFKYKFIVLTIGGIATYVVFRLLKFSNKDLGINNLHLKKSLFDVLPITITVALLTIILYFIGYSRMIVNEDIFFVFFYIFISCPIQELLYRGMLNSYLNLFIHNRNLKIFIGSLIFCFVHIIYHDPLTVFFTFIIGLIWYYSYDKTNNLFGVTISHIILGIATIMLGFI